MENLLFDMIGLFYMNLKILAIVLICFGIYMLCNSVVSVLAGMGIYISYEVNQFLLHYIPQFIVAFVIIAVGLRMIAGKKQEIEFDENDNDGFIGTNYSLYER